MEATPNMTHDDGSGGRPLLESACTRREFVDAGVRLGVGAALASVLAPLTGCLARTVPVPDESHKLVTDWRDRTVVVPLEPQRISAMDAFAGEVLVMIGAGPRLTSVQDGTRSSTLLCQVYPSLAQLPRFMADGAVNIESLLASATEVAFVKEAVFSSPGQKRRLDRSGVPYVVIDYYTVDEQMDAITLVGDVCGGEQLDQAQALIGHLRDIVERVEERAKNIPEAERLRVYHAMNVATMTSGRRSIAHDWIARAGAHNVSTEGGRASKVREYKTSLEEVFTWDPDVIVCNDPETTEYFRTDSKWSRLRAVREERVHQLPIGATRWGHWGSFETALAMLWFGVTLYPEHFSDIDLKAEVVTYYREVAGLAIDDATYEMVLSGRGLRTKTTGGEG